MTDAHVEKLLAEARRWLTAALAVHDPEGHLDDVSKRLMRVVMDVDGLRETLVGRAVAVKSEAA